MITITGDIYLTDEPTMKYMPDGSAITTFPAWTHNGKDKNGQNKTIWLDCTIFSSKLAEVANQYLHKKSGISVVAKLRSEDGNPRTYVAKDGSTRSRFEIVIDSFGFLNSQEKQAQ